MKKIDVVEKTGVISKEVIIYKIFKMGSASFIVKCNERPVDCVFKNEKACFNYIDCMTEF